MASSSPCRPLANERCCRQRHEGALRNCAAPRAAPFTANLVEPLQQNAALGEPVRKPSKPPTTIIDREKMPFSEAELYAALHLLFPIRIAKELARGIAVGIRDERWSEASAAEAIARGSRKPEEINPSRLFYPEVVPFLLALLSPRLHDRVMQWRTADRVRMHRGRMMSATFSLTGRRPTEPWPEEAVRRISDEYEREDANWVVGLEHVRQEVSRIKRDGYGAPFVVTHRAPVT